MDEYSTQSPQWDVLLDLDALAAGESEDWIWRGAHVRPSDDRAILRLSRGGSDAVVLREFDLTAHAFILDGFTVPEAKSSVDWLDRDLLLLSSALGGGMATNSGYARTVRLWRRGQSPFDAPVIHAVPATYMAVSAALDRESEGERVVLSHHAEDRALFARGALKAVLWAKDRKPGLYSMTDVLGLSED